jgi:hypothetical protein
MAETVFTFQLAVLFFCLARFTFPWRPGPGLLIGFVFMSALWLKGTNSLFGPLFVAWSLVWLFGHRRTGWKPLLRPVALAVAPFVVGAALVVGSYAAYTGHFYGKVQTSAPTGALNFIEGKCPAKHNIDSGGMQWLSPLFVHLGETGEKRWSHPFTEGSYFWKEGLECVKRDPAVLATSVRYLYYLFFDNPLWPVSSTSYGALAHWYCMAYSVFVFPALLLGAIYLALRPRSRLTMISLIGVSLLVSSWLLKSEMRYRVPFDVIFIPIAVLAASWVLPKLLPRRRARR